MDKPTYGETLVAMYLAGNDSILATYLEVYEGTHAVDSSCPQAIISNCACQDEQDGYDGAACFQDVWNKCNLQAWVSHAMAEVPCKTKAGYPSYRWVSAWKIIGFDGHDLIQPYFTGRGGKAKAIAYAQTNFKYMGIKQ